jgi:hypothetical protein
MRHSNKGGKGKEKEQNNEPEQHGGAGSIVRMFKNTHATSGEFSVTGDNSISFEVKCNNFKHILVCFADPEPQPIPCVPFVPDALHVNFTAQNGPLSLITISWKVSGVRKIAWCVKG